MLRLFKRRKGEKGQALIITVLLLTFLVSVIIMGTLVFVGTSLHTNKTYDQNTISTYSAEAGVQDSIWYMENYSPAQLNGFLTPAPAADQPSGLRTANLYNQFDYSTVWTYTAPQLAVNSQSVSPLISNVWVPTNIPVPTTPQDQALAAAISHSSNLIVAGTANNSANPPTYTIDITYNDTTSLLPVASIGVWLPLGFTYVNGSSNLNGYFSSESVVSAAGNEAVVWTLNSALFSNLWSEIGGGSTSSNLAITFQYNASNNAKTPNAVGWITTNSTLYPYSWNSTVSVYEIAASAGNTQIQSYITNSSTHLLGSAVSGDYYAAGTSPMIDDNGNSKYRELVLSSSSSVVAAIPSDASVDAAYLYWTGWTNNVRYGGTAATNPTYNNVVWWDNCEPEPNPAVPGSAPSTVYAITNKWPTQSGWTWTTNSATDNSYYFEFQGSGNNSYIKSQSINLTGVTLATLHWNQSTSNTGGTYTVKIQVGSYSTTENVTASNYNYSLLIPTSYLNTVVTITVTLQSGFGSTNLYLDNISITNDSEASPAYLADTSLSLEITSKTGAVNNDSGALPVSVSASNPNDIVWSAQVLSGGTTADGYYYACKKDVTNLVKEYSDGFAATVNGDGNGTYVVSGLYSDTMSQMNQGDLADSGFAGWSLVIIYSDASTLGHQLYLFDEFESIPNNSGDNPIPISGFVVPSQFSTESSSADAAKLTVFVGEGDQQLHQNDHVGLISYNASGNGTEHVLWDGVTDDPYDTSPSNSEISSSALDVFNSESRNPADWNYSTNQWSTTSQNNIYGTDLDTFHISWVSGILTPGATTATINLHTEDDGVVSVFVIASFRSQVTSGGSVSYLITRRQLP